MDRTSEEKLIEMNKSLIADNNYLREQLAAARIGCERYAWFREHGESHSKKLSKAIAYRPGPPIKAMFQFAYWCSPEELDAEVDRMRRG